MGNKMIAYGLKKVTGSTPGEIWMVTRNEILVRAVRHDGLQMFLMELEQAMNSNPALVMRDSFRGECQIDIAIKVDITREKFCKPYTLVYNKKNPVHSCLQPNPVLLPDLYEKPKAVRHYQHQEIIELSNGVKFRLEAKLYCKPTLELIEE